MKHAHNFKDLTGIRFGRLVAIEFIKKPDRPKESYYRCRCDCGAETISCGRDLRSGASASCGCYTIERIVETKTKHGHCHRNSGQSGTCQSWVGMKQRCTNPNDEFFKDYGGRGILICERWLHSFENFLADMGIKPDGFSIERIDVNGNYEPGNCVWIPANKQARNKRNTIRVTVCGETKTLLQWCELRSLNYDAVRGRIRLGWDAIEAMDTPIRKGNYHRKQ